MCPLPFPYGIQQLNTGPIINLPSPTTDLTDVNGQIQSARVINPITGDYELNANGTFTGQSVVWTSVYLALFTTLNSSAVYGLGNAIGNIPVIGTNITNQVTNVIKQALSSLIVQGLVSLTNCVVTQIAPSTLNVAVNWTDLTINSVGQNTFTTNVTLPTPNNQG